MQKQKTTRRRPNGYWRDRKNIEYELRAWVAEHGDFPRFEQLNGGLAIAISRSGGILRWREQLGFTQLQKPRGYWFDPAIIERELRAWIEEHGRFPTTEELRKTKNASLSVAIVRSGGVSAWRALLGFEDIIKPPGFWDDEANIERELREWIKEYGRFPTHPALEKTRRHDLIGAIAKHGGILSWRTRLRYTQSQNPPGYWDSEENIERELRIWIERHGRFPTQKDLQTTHASGLAGGIQKHGGLRKQRDRFGYPDQTQPTGYWNDQANIERELRAWIEKHDGRFPTTTELTPGGLRYAIHRNKGMAYWQRHFGFNPTRVSNGYWDDEANIERELRAWIEKHDGRFPTAKNLRFSGGGGLAAAISLRGGYPRWRHILGHTQIKRPLRYWDDQANIERELRAWIEKHDGRFPTTTELKKEGQTALVTAVGKEGFRNWRLRLGYKNEGQRPGYWDSEENIERELRIWIERHGRFPTQKDLQRTGASSLSSSIGRHGGFSAWQAMLGYETTKRPHGYWSDPNNIERELREWIHKHGAFPTQRRLYDTRKSSLIVAITRTGGLLFWHSRMGYDLVTSEILKDHADSLVRILFALQVERPALTSDAFWGAIMAHWTEADLKTGLTAFTDHGDLTAFRSLLSR